MAVSDAGRHAAPAALPSHQSGGERPRRAACVRDELLPDGSLVLSDACQQRTTTLNATAGFVWECCDGEHSIAMIVEEIREVFPDASNVAEDVLVLLQALIDGGLVLDESL